MKLLKEVNAEDWKSVKGGWYDTSDLIEEMDREILLEGEEIKIQKWENG